MNFSPPAVYRLWIVDDSPEDREILRYLLSRSDQQYTIREFDSAAALLRALGDSSEEGPDCILLDYQLPDDDALALLPKLGGPDALAYPIVVVTGYENSDAGRAVLRLGAQDFIGKSWFSTGSLTRCIENSTERFALRGEFAEQENRFSTLFHSSGDALGLFSEGGFTDCNAALLKLFGCVDPEEFLGKDPAYFSPPLQPDGRDSSELAGEHIAEAFRTGANRFEWHHCRLDGTPFLADVMLTGIRVGGRPVLQACMRDITAQKEAEAEIRRLNAELESRVQDRTRELVATNEVFRSTLIALDRVDIGVHWSDYATGRTLHASPAAAKIIGYSQEELLELSITDIVVGFPFAETAPAIRAAGMMRLEVNARHKDGHDVQVLTIVRFQEASDGFPDRFIAFIQDVSEQHRLRARMLDYQLNLERLVAERTTELERTTAQLAITLNALDKVGFGVAWIDCDSAKLLQTNESCAAMLDYDRDEVKGLSLYDIEPDLTPEAYATSRETVRSRGHGNFERKVRTKKGEMRTVSLYLFYLVPGSDETGVFISFIEDITERRRLEEQLHRSEERFRLAMNAAQEGIWDWNMQTGEVYFSPGYTTMLGYADGDFAPHFNTWVSLLHPDEVESVINEADHLLAKSGNFNLEFRMRCKDGAYIWVLSRGEIVERDPEGLPTRAIGTHMDITQRREAKARLDELVRQQQVILDNASIGIMYLKDRKVVWCNHVMEKLLGYGRGELFGLPSTAFYVLASEADYVQAAEQARVVLAQGKQWSGEYLGKRKDGSQFWCRLSGQAIDPADPFAGVIACIDDITERKQWEAEIAAARDTLEQQVRERTRELAETNVNLQTTLIAMDHAGIGVTWVDITTARFLHVNDAAARMLGYQPDEMLHLSVLDIVPEVSPEVFARMSTRIRQEGTVRIEAEQLAKDGRRIPTEVTLCHQQAVGERDEHNVAFVVDISERKRSEAAARERERFIDAVVEAAGHVIVVLDRAGCIVRFNRAAEALTGYRFQQLENQPIWDYLIPPERMADVRGIFDKLVRGVWVNEFENEWLTKDGSRRLLQWHNTLLHDEEGQITHVVASGYDLTHIRTTQRELERSEARFRALFESAQDGILLADIKSRRFVAANPAMCDLLGYRQAELLTLGIADIHPAEQLPHLIQVFDQFARDKGRMEHHLLDGVRILRKDGTERRVNITPALITGNDQQLIAGLFRDVTERNQREAKLVETLRQLYDNEQALDAVGIGVHWAHYETGLTLYASQAAANILGYSQEELLKLSITDFAVGFPFAEAAPGIRAAGTVRLDITVRHKDGHDFPALVIIRYQEANDDFPARFIAFVEDITEQKQAEARLLKAKQAAEAANDAKNLFLAHMSHEIRTPLNAMLGLAQLLEREPLEPGETAMVRHIREAGDSLLHIINDILDFSKIEAGEFTLEQQPFALGELLRRLRNLMAVAAEAKHLQLSIVEPADCPATLLGDAMRLEQVLFNLCANAIKFTQTGEIVVTVTPLAVTANEARLRIEVRDTGIGIAAETLGQLFRAFHQGDSSISRRFGGTGLGLVISRRLVELMGGRIGASSTPGKGSTFWFEVPFARVPELAPTPVVPAEPKPVTNTAGSTPRLAGLRVLVVDDNRLNRIVAGRALQLEGAVLAEAKDGQEALDRLLEQPREFDVVLMDIQMPIMDGLTATRHIRKTPPLAELPVVALSAGVLKEEREAALEAGVNDFLPKPLELERLVAVLRPLLSVGRADA